MINENPIDIFKRQAPEVAAAFDNLINSLIKNKGLDAKTKQLVYIGILAEKGYKDGIKLHVSMAKKLGCTREEVVDTILLTLAISGLTGIITCLKAALESYDQTN